MARIAVILAAAGKSGRFQDPHYKKPFVPLAERAVWLHSAEKFVNRDDVQQLVVVISADDREAFMSSRVERQELSQYVTGCRRYGKIWTLLLSMMRLAPAWQRFGLMNW
jgi:2-C-methyl-D-erythritol 4-phosphate cytidylyltransferase